MRIYPAIDLKNGQCVRLKQGRFDEVTIYDEDPVERAKIWEKSGAEYIHVVDLDGADTGNGKNLNSIKNIVKAVNIPVQTGGGIRCLYDIKERIEAGVNRVIIGTAAVKNPNLVKEAASIYGNKIAVGIDASNGMVAIDGWKNITDVTAVELCEKMKSYGVRTFIYTDISKDGMMTGPNIESTKKLVDIGETEIIASGGVSSVDDLYNLKDICVEGAIIGKALYNGAIDLKEIIKYFE